MPVGLFKCGKKWLESCKMSDEFKNSENTSDSNQSNDFSGFSDNVKFWEVIQYKGKYVGKYSEQVH